MIKRVGKDLIRSLEEIINGLAYIAIDNTFCYRRREEYDSTTDFLLSYVTEDDYEDEIWSYLNNEEIETYSIMEIWNKVKEFIIKEAINHF
jgi:hypothetical protein